MHDAHFWAMVLALLACGVGAAVHQRWMDHDRDPHSPDPRWQLVSWVKSLVGRETSHETDPDVSPGDDRDEVDGQDVEEYEWGFIDRSEGSTRVDVRPPDAADLTQLEGWVLRELRAGTGSEEIARGAKRRFGASRATAYRVMREMKRMG